MANEDDKPLIEITLCDTAITLEQCAFTQQWTNCCVFIVGSSKAGIWTHERGNEPSRRLTSKSITFTWLEMTWLNTKHIQAIIKDPLIRFSINPSLRPLGIFGPGQPARGWKLIPARQPNGSNKSHSDGLTVLMWIYKSHLLFKGKDDLQYWIWWPMFDECPSGSRGVAVLLWIFGI